MQHVADLFPVPIAGFDLKSDTDNMIDHLLSLDAIVQGENGSFSKDQQVLDNPIFNELKKEVYQHLYDYIDYCKHNVEGIKIVSSWSNTVNQKEHIHTHCHENSYISGVIHLTEGSDLIIKKPLVKTFFKIDTEYNDNNQDDFRIPAKKGQLILFPSMLFHTVEHQETNTKRVSIAFNTWPLKYGSPAAWVDLTQP
jgi:uncharacterized protein (TIGR02466 family)